MFCMFLNTKFIWVFSTNFQLMCDHGIGRTSNRLIVLFLLKHHKLYNYCKKHRVTYIENDKYKSVLSLYTFYNLNKNIELIVKSICNTYSSLPYVRHS